MGVHQNDVIISYIWYSCGHMVWKIPRCSFLAHGTSGWCNFSVAPDVHQIQISTCENIFELKLATVSGPLIIKKRQPLAYVRTTSQILSELI